MDDRLTKGIDRRSCVISQGAYREDLRKSQKKAINIAFSLFLVFVLIFGTAASLCFADQEDEQEDRDAALFNDQQTSLLNSVNGESFDLADDEQQGESREFLLEEDSDRLDSSAFGANNLRVSSFVSNNDLLNFALEDSEFEDGDESNQGTVFRVGNVLPRTVNNMQDVDEGQSSQGDSAYQSSGQDTSEITMTEEEFKQYIYDFFSYLELQQIKDQDENALQEYLDQKRYEANRPRQYSAGAPSVTLSQEQSDAITEATSSLSQTGYDFGYILVDLDTGNSIYYNIDQKVYGASSFKGPFCHFLCEDLIDTGRVSQSSVKYSVESVILYSDNNAYRSLRYAYNYLGFADYLESLGLDSVSLMQGGSFPSYSARTSAVLWLDTYQYLLNRFDNPTAQWLTELYGDTAFSPIREGVEESALDGYVLNKAGWIAGSVNSMSDSALIEVGNKTYLLSIMTGQPDSYESQKRVTELTTALMNAAPALDPEAYGLD